MNKRDFRYKYIKVISDTQGLVTNVWYRSPLWDDDHLLGAELLWKDDEIAWCGRALGAARDWEDDVFGGLWLSERRSGKHTYCARRQREWDSRNGQQS